MWYIGQTWEAWPLLDAGLGHIRRLQHAYDLPLPNQPNISKWFSEFFSGNPHCGCNMSWNPKEWCRYECMCAWIIDICVAGWTRRSNSACRQTSSLMRGIANTCPNNKEYVKKCISFECALIWITNQHSLSFKPYFKNSHKTLLIDSSCS